MAMRPIGSDGLKVTGMMAPMTHASSNRHSKPANARPFSASGANRWVRLSKPCRPVVAASETAPARATIPTVVGAATATKDTRPAAARHDSKIACSSTWRRNGPAMRVPVKPAMPPASKATP